MSFILDALKKSESDRQRQSTPGFSDVAEGTERKSSPRWLWVLGGLLFINVLVLAVVLLRPDPQPAATTSLILDTPIRREASSSRAAEAEDSSSNFSEIVADAKKQQPAPAPPVTESPAREQPVVATATEPVEFKSPPPSTLTTAYETFNEVRAAGLVQLPDLHLDIHVYSEQAADRFVFVNMSKYKEYAALSEGPVVSEIVPEGVILEYRGTKFLLPRQ
jgi:general secretion pathway protein B